MVGNYRENLLFFADFGSNAADFLCPVRLCGGEGSLALTVLRRNSLLTGNLTGNFGISGLPKAALLISKPHISGEKQTFDAQIRAGNFQGCIREFDSFISDACRESGFEAELLKPGAKPGMSARATAFLPERIPTVRAARPSSRECPGTTSESSSREAADPPG
ncbi:MAG: hypothetical protein ACRD23_10435 [Terriglobales bacterium]